MYDERSKRIYGESDDLNIEYGWSDGFDSTTETEIPFSELSGLGDLKKECEELMKMFAGRSGTDDDFEELIEAGRDLSEKYGNTKTVSKIVGDVLEATGKMMEEKGSKQ